jgi:hypothetical protein
MSALSILDSMTPVEVARRQGSGEAVKIIETLAETNELLKDAYFTPASDRTVHKTTQRSTQPSGTRRVYGQGVPSQTSQTKQIEDYIEMLGAYSDVDAKMVDHSPNPKTLLESEDTAFVAGMGITMLDDLLYAKRSDGPEYANGFYSRFGVNIAADPKNLFGVETSGSNTASLLIIKWGPGLAELIYPPGDGEVGVKREFRGKQDVVVSAGPPVLNMPVYRTWFEANFGASVRSPYAVKRVCNIVPGTSTGEAICKKINAAMRKLPPGPGTVVIYGNSDVLTLFDNYALTQSNRFYNADDPWGKKITMFGEARIRQLERMLSTESLVAAS